MSRPIEFRAWFTIQKTMYSPYEFMGMAGFVDFLKNKTVIPMQFTGLLDKNGKKIFEGDILEFDRYEWGDNGNKAIVKYERGEFTAIGLKSEWDKWCEVIGNIWENTELLKE